MIRRPYVFTGIALLFFAVASSVYATAAPERSVSSSRQFIVYGDNPRLRAAICDVAERCKRDVLKLLGKRDEWRTPIVVQAASPQANQPELPAARLNMSQTGAGLKFQLEFSIAREVNVPEIERDLLRVIYLEILYRSALDSPPGTPSVEPPDWLIEGTAALSPDREFTAMAQALATVTDGNVLKLEEFLRQRRERLDSPSQTLHRAYSAALLSMLIEGPEGRDRLRGFVTDLVRAGSDPLADLRKHFPWLGEDSGRLELSWRAHVARLAGRQSSRLLSCDETERELAALLRVHVRTTVYGLEEFSEFLRDPAAATDLQRLATQLLLLSGRANLLYRPIIAEYQQIVTRLLRRKGLGISQRLADARGMREQLIRRMSAVADYMNWFEATQAHSTSGVFRGYLRTAELTQEPEPRRRDPISVYLDALESQF